MTGEFLTIEEEMALWRQGIDMAEMIASLLNAGCSEAEIWSAIEEKRRGQMGVN